MISVFASEEEEILEAICTAGQIQKMSFTAQRNVGAYSGKIGYIVEYEN